MPESLARYSPQALSVLRIVVALLFMEHGTQKLFGFPVPTQEMGSDMGMLITVAGILEFAGGLMLLVGFFTRPVAFILSGQMAVAYFMAHAPQDFFPVNNQGDAAVLFCFAFLYFVFAGPGAWSIDQSVAAEQDDFRDQSYPNARAR